MKRVYSSFPSFTVLFLLSILLFFIYLFGSYYFPIYSFSSIGGYSFREGLSGNIPIHGKVYENRLILTTATILSTGDILQTIDLKNILDISTNPVTIMTGSTIATSTYSLSGIVDPSGIVPYNIDISMNINTANMPDQTPKQINITGIIPSNSPTLNVINVPSSTIKPNYLLLGSASNQLNDSSGNPISIKLGSYPTFTLSAVPNQDYITPDISMNYIIEENK